MIEIKVGADPELFVRDMKSGQFVSAHTFLPGTKVEPFKVPLGAVQVDGTAAEFNIDPASDHVQFITHISTVMDDLQKRTKEAGCELVVDPVCEFEPTYFRSLPDNVKELGCNPDFCAWTGQVNPAPDGESTTLRTASGHIHLGWHKKMVNPHDPMHFEDCCAIVKQLDYYLGLYSLMWDPDNRRRQLYGKAGAFRPKPYGVEYRTMSNVWLRSANVQKWIFVACQMAVKAMTEGNKTMEELFGDKAKNWINSGTRWWETSDGKVVHATMGMKWPNYTECLSTPKMKEEKKQKAYHRYDSGLMKVSIDEWIGQAQLNNTNNTIILGNTGTAN